MSATRNYQHIYKYNKIDFKKSPILSKDELFEEIKNFFLANGSIKSTLVQEKKHYIYTSALRYFDNWYSAVLESGLDKIDGIDINAAYVDEELKGYVQALEASGNKVDTKDLKVRAFNRRYKNTKKAA